MLQDIANDCASKLGIKKKVDLRLYTTMPSPMLIGFFTPIIVVPRVDLQLDDAQMILAHELVHFKHHDLWRKLFAVILGNKRRYFANYADCKGKGSATDYISNTAIVYGYAVNTLENRLKAKVCELCGTTESDHYEVHHINKLKNLKGKERWEIAMIAKHRKTLVVCRNCHRSIIHKK